jgi:hypothetical protein
MAINYIAKKFYNISPWVQPRTELHGVVAKAHDTQHNDYEHNDTQHNDTQHYDVQH